MPQENQVIGFFFSFIKFCQTYLKQTLVMQHPVKGWGTHAKGLAPEVVVGGLYPELSLV